MLAPVLATALGLSVCHKSKLSKRLNESSWFWHGSIIPPIRHCVKRKFGYLHTHTHPFNGPLSGTTRVSRYQKGKTNLDFTAARDSEWQWNQLDHMQACTLLQTDNHASTHHSVFYRPDALPAAQPTVSMHWRYLQNKSISLWNFVPDSELGKFCVSISIVETCYRLNSRKVDAQKLDCRRSTKLTIPPSSDARPLVYRSSHQALFTAKFRPAGQLEVYSCKRNS